MNQPTIGPCHNYTECPGYIYAWKQRFIDPGKLGDDSLDASPILLEATTPIYPKWAWDKRIEGYAIYKFDIDPTGRPMNIRVIQSRPGDTFTKAGIDAIKLSRYTKTNLGAVGLRIQFDWTVDGSRLKMLTTT
jgi:TonB family protein